MDKRGKRGIVDAVFEFLGLGMPNDEPRLDRNVEDVRRRRRRRHSSGDRDTWGRKIEYILSCLGYAVGLGNFWRFPYLCYRNGGGAFLIPYLFFMCISGIPVLLMEMGFGQFASLGPITIWRICPLFKGIGISIVVILILVNTYYNVVVAYTLFYFFASITSELPWESCDNKWNTPNCIVLSGANAQNKTIDMALKNPLLNYSTNGSLAMAFVANRKLLKTPSEEFFERHVLEMTDGIDNLGEIQWPLVVCLAVSWFICFMCLFRGVKSLGKAVYFTTTFSYVILTVLLIRGVTLPGSMEGLVFYLKPDWEKLKQMKVWGEAASQMFASLSLGIGGWITLASYNKFNNKCTRDAIVVALCNALTSIYAGFVIFSVLGFMAHKKGLRVEDVVSVGPGLVFVAYPEGIGMMPGAPFWAICFFFLMFSVGLDSLFGQVETMAAGITDEFPELLRPHRKLFTLFLCVFMALCGLPLITQGGIYVMTLMDWYTLLMSFLIISLIEIVVIMYIYGFKRFSEDMTLMFGSAPSMYFTVCWVGITPVVILIVIGFLSANYAPPFYGNYKFPRQAESIGWLLGLGPLLFIPLGMIFQLLKFIGCGNFTAFFKDKHFRMDVLRRLVTPTEDWGPALPEIRRKFSYNMKLGSVSQADPDDDVFDPAGDTEMTHVVNKNSEHVHVHSGNVEAMSVAQVKFEDDVIQSANTQSKQEETEPLTQPDKEETAVDKEDAPVKTDQPTAITVDA